VGGAVGESRLLWGLLFSCVGTGFFLYGKQQRSAVPLLCGLALVIYPYFVSNVIAMILIGIALASVPYFFRE
jgi:hypothetical protein